jgi:hypothetical protein
MSFSSDFFSGFWNYVTGLHGWGIVVVIIIALMAILAPLIIMGFKSLFKWIGSLFKSKRSCGDCILLIFGTSERYKVQMETLRRNILMNQMTYVEQKIESLTLELLRTYKEDQVLIVNEKSVYSIEIVDRDYINYKEALSNAIDLSKKEIRRSFKENGFHTKEGKDFADYVKEKAVDLLSIARKYMMNAYYRDSFVPLEYRFKKFDERKFEDLVFEVYIKAKEVVIDTENKVKELENKFKIEIDNLVKERK